MVKIIAVYKNQAEFVEVEPSNEGVFTYKRYDTNDWEALKEGCWKLLHPCKKMEQLYQEYKRRLNEKQNTQDTEEF